jgi:hypothetical protein
VTRLAQLAAAMVAAVVGAGSVPSPLSGGEPGGPIAKVETTVAAPDTVDPSLRGIVRASGFRDGEGLPGAILELRQGRALLRVTSDAEGRYRMSGVEPGRARLSVFHVATSPVEFEVTLPAKGDLEMDIVLERRVLELPPVTVSADIAPPAPARPTAPFPSPGTRTARLLVPSLEATSGFVESGLGGAVPGEPGDEPGDAGRVLYMRGSTVDSRQVLLDGAPILTPFHLAGLVPSFDAGVLGDARLHLGGAPARYDGGLSYILDVQTRAPGTDRIRGEVSVDPVAARLGLDLPLGGSAGLLGSIRDVHGLAAGGDFPYRYRDALVRFAAQPSPNQRIGITAFQNREGVHLGDLGATTLSPGIDLASWGNRAISARWYHSGAGHRIEAVAAASGYDASLPINWPDPVVARTRADRIRGEVTVQHSRLRWGGGAERQAFRWDLMSLSALPQTRVDARGASRTADRAGGFAELELPLSAEVGIRGGIRADWFGVDSRLRFAPRAAFRYRLTEDAFLTLSAGRYHETLPISAIASQEETAGNARLFWAPTLRVSSANHIVLALDQALSPDLRFEVSGFAKRFDGSDAPVHASGTDLRVTRGGESFEGWIGYALTWVWSSPGAGGGGGGGGAGGAEGGGGDGAEPRPREFAGRHLLSSGARVTLANGLDLGVTLGYGAGLPLTGVGLATTMPEDVPGMGGSRIPPVETQSGVDRFASASAQNPLEVAAEDDFLRLDLEASWRVRPTIAGRSTEFRPYLRVLNALDRRDALFHYFERWRDEDLRPVATRPFLPLVGVEWRF